MNSDGMNLHLENKKSLNEKIQENVDIEIIDRLMSKLLKAPINKKMLSLNRHTKGKYVSNEAR